MNQRHFWWDDSNIEHIADHGVEPFEAEEVINNRPLVSRAGEGKLITYGQTDVGRYLVVVYALKDQQRLRVITARDMTQAEKSRIRGRRK